MTLEPTLKVEKDKDEGADENNLYDTSCVVSRDGYSSNSPTTR